MNGVIHFENRIELGNLRRSPPTCAGKRPEGAAHWLRHEQS